MKIKAGYIVRYDSSREKYRSIYFQYMRTDGLNIWMWIIANQKMHR